MPEGVFCVYECACACLYICICMRMTAPSSVRYYSFYRTSSGLLRFTISNLHPLVCFRAYGLTTYMFLIHRTALTQLGRHICGPKCYAEEYIIHQVN